MRVQIICFLLVLLAATYLCLDGPTNPRYNKFIKQHVIQKMSASECDHVMKARGINNNRNCKNTNTFILATNEVVKSVCGKNGAPYKENKNMTISLQHFDIVVCKLKKQPGKKEKGKSKCQYDGEKLNKRIIIACIKGYPVHYDNDIDYID
ncbi:ribonuclease-like [Parambassis ranga]|uniref:Ribonuclease-like n=1 Tax=Parambassis ranga TaxID=210632 RepID=A0A6P7J6P9_9TELE|nr:ribonuclease-like [Parambassis ranga]